MARVSREAPVLILEYDSTEIVPGAGGNAANNVITGNGLKTLEAVKDRIGAPTTIAPTLASFEERVLSA